MGLLSLSSVTVRSASQDAAINEARANARLALQLAIGELQKHAGPDQRITARADILGGNTANPYLTGVWNSRRVDGASLPTSNEFSGTARDREFLTWLVSNQNPNRREETQFARLGFDNEVTLWKDGTLGQNADRRSHVTAPRVETETGAYAWAVLDEGVKARINTPHRENTPTTTERIMALGAGERPAVEFIEGLESFNTDDFAVESTQFETIKKAITQESLELVSNRIGGGDNERIQELYHDITTSSVGLFTDTQRGGLRKDFHLMTSGEELPNLLTQQGIYETELGFDQVPQFDPSWQTLFDFAKIYEDKISKDGSTPVIEIQAPTEGGWVAAQQGQGRGGNTETSINKQTPPGLVLMPTIAKVKMIFSLVGRELYRTPPSLFQSGTPINIPTRYKRTRFHGPQDGHFARTKYDYDLHLLYTPVVTLHNPYNVALEFENLRVQFEHVPFAMQVFRNGEAQSRDLVPFETMWQLNERGTGAKIFGLNLREKSNGRPGIQRVRLLPGEVKIFSPYIDPRRSYADEVLGRGTRAFWHWNFNRDTSEEVDAIPGWRGDGIGFDADWLAGGIPIDGNANAGRWRSCLGLAGDDLIQVKFAMGSTPTSQGKFTVSLSGKPYGQSDQGQNNPIVNVLEVNYSNDDLLNTTVLGSPDATLTWPKEDPIEGRFLVDHSTTQIGELRNVKPFAMLSLQAKTPFGGLTTGSEGDTKYDGQLATKPFAFAHPNIGVSVQDIASEHPSVHSHEIDLQLIDGSTEDVIEIDDNDRSRYITGHTAENGLKFGTQYEVPLAPIQSLSTLNGANPSGASSSLPRYGLPIGNSWAHPMMSPETVFIPGGAGETLLDHSFLLNSALYDSFYFSGLADQTGPFGSGSSTEILIADLVEGLGLADPRIVLHQPDDRTTSELSELLNDPIGFQKIAAWQKMLGSFNINSTSAEAWTAMLASMQDINSVTGGRADDFNISSLPSTGGDTKRISRFRVPLEPAEDSARESYWLGAREYSKSEIRELAENIVILIRERGPFLSLSEFVNRPLGTGEEAQKGILQQAIDNSNLNRDLGIASNAGYEIPDATIRSYGLANPEAGTGSSFQGAPGFLTQADLMSVLGNAATARSDTFTIRGYGESRAKSGKILATAICEATLQRNPEWLDSEDRVETPVADLQSETNRVFGRRFEIVSFRWLKPDNV
ncbi:MAG: hypothetical protein AAGC74_06080 [Verrucomicrobiota bacterium]